MHCYWLPPARRASRIHGQLPHLISRALHECHYCQNLTAVDFDGTNIHPYPPSSNPSSDVSGPSVHERADCLSYWRDWVGRLLVIQDGWCKCHADADVDARGSRVAGACGGGCEAVQRVGGKSERLSRLIV